MFDMVLSLVGELVPVLIGQLFRPSTESNLDSAAATPTSAPDPRRPIEKEASPIGAQVGWI